MTAEQNEVLLLKNKHDRLLEHQRDSDIYELKKDRYKLSDKEYNELYFTIHNKYEKMMYRAWLNK